MAKTIPQLPEALSVNDDDLFVIQQGSRTKKILASNLNIGGGSISNFFDSGEIYLGDPANSILRIKAIDEKMHFQIKVLDLWEDIAIFERVI